MKVLYITILFMFIYTLTGCSANNADDNILPPTRIGTDGIMRINLMKRFYPEVAYTESDLVAHVKIGNWLGENNDIKATYYNAEIIKILKGNEIKNITLIQDGSSSVTVRNYPLFINNNELLVFLKCAIDMSNIEYENVYWIIGSYTTVLDVAYSKSGEIYYLDKYGVFGETIDKNYKQINTPVIQELYEYMSNTDFIYFDNPYKAIYIFAATDIETLLSSFIN